MEPLLQVEHLSISFTQYDRGARQRSLPVIRDLSFAIRPGQVTAVVGSSGSGKSLLAHGILGILHYNAHLEGIIAYGGETLTQRRAEALRGREIVLVPQGVTYLDPLMAVGPQLRRGRRDAAARSQSRAALARYGLGPEVESLYPFELSGGMARRVLIATAAVEHPSPLLRQFPEVAQNAPGGPGVQAGGGLVGDEQFWVFHRGGGDEHPPGHAAGELEGVELLRLRPQAVPGQDAPALRPGGGVPPPPAHLGAYRHQGVQVGDPLGDQDDLPAPQGLSPFLGERFPTVENGPLHGAVVGEDTQNPVGK